MIANHKACIFILSVVAVVFSFRAASQTPDPGLMGTHTVVKAEYNLGDLAYTPPAAAMFPANMEVRGSVHYPADLSSGPFPVLLWLHGRHETCYNLTSLATSSTWPCPAGDSPIVSYEGYDYAAKTMASHGYIVISISANAINAIDGGLSDDGMNARGVLVQHHLDLWNTWNTTGGAPFGTLFVGKLNMKNIGTMGHSRGGEGVIFNAQYNKSLGSPYGIKAILTLAPVDFYRHIVNEIPLLNIAPYCDGDVNDLQGVHFYDDTRYNDTADFAPKHNILVMGADHNFFNTIWTPNATVAGGEDDWLYSYSPTASFCGPNASPTGRLDTTKQKAVYNAYAAAFYRLYIGHETQFAPILEVKDIIPPASSLVDTSKIYVSYHPGRHDRLDVNTTDTVADLTTNTVGGAVTSTALTGPEICGGGLAQVVCDAGLGGAQKPHRGTGSTKGLGQMKLAWTDTTGSYQNDIPAGRQDVSGYSNLSFRAAVDFSETTIGPLNFTVVLIDSAGTSASQVVGNFSNALFHQPGTTSNDLPKVVFNTISLPLSGFTGVKLNKIRHIKFRFNKTTTGAVLVSDLAFTNPVCGNLNAFYSDSVGKRYKVFFTDKTNYTVGDSLRWLWNFGDPGTGTADTSTLKNPTHTFSTHGTYTICMYVADYRKTGMVCYDTLCTTLVLANDAVPQVFGQDINIYPNPARNYVTVSGAAATSVLTLHNVYGQVVLSSSIGTGTVKIPDAIAPGIYTAMIVAPEGTVVRKLVIER